MGVAGNSAGAPPYVIFRQALDAGDLDRIRMLAPQMPRIQLADALRICLLLRDDEEARDRASLRWIGRFALEARGATLADFDEAWSALKELASDPDGAMERLLAVCARCHVA